MDSAARMGAKALSREATLQSPAVPARPHATPETEAAWVSAAQRGDREAFAKLIARHQQAIYGYLQARLLEPADAEDLCQEVFLRCYLGREKLSLSVSVESWLMGIAKNVLREHVRRITRRKEVAWTELCLELDSLMPPEQAEHRALDHLPGCLESLGPSAREAIDLRYKAKLSMEQISQQFSRSEGAVRLMVHRARQALRHCLEQKLTAEKKT
jgi:RNA polymerase sigma-70 factor (ECF subfamily)